MIVLVKYKQWLDSGHSMLDDTIEIRTKIVEVANLLDLNDMFRSITDVKILKE